MKELLIEIGVEELPAIPFLKELPNIKAKWQAILSEYRLESEFDFYFTPRRLVFFHKNFSEFQSDTKAEFIGAPRHVAIKDGAFTPAALSFAKKCEISQNELVFKEIDGKDVLFYEKQIKGLPTQNLLGDMIEKFLLSLNFGKSMRWGRGEFEFIRPVRSFLCLFGDKNVEFSKFGIKSEASTYPHRSVGYEKVPVLNASDYFNGAKNRGIILNQDERKSIILEQFKNLEKSGISIEIDPDLLNEVVAITEYPNALLGEFESEFLAVPSEVIITSMKENQRYFPVFKDGKLANKFVVVSNAITDDNTLIIKGNQKVLRARLSDAVFFWQSDLASDFSPEKLKNITYLKELGSMYDKELRELKIAEILAKRYEKALLSEVGADFKDKLKRAVMLSKADLTSAMVYEFTELEGIMGHYYARAKGESEAVVMAIKEQYLPDGEGSAVPSSVFSAVVALANKLDTLVGLFSVGKIPTGTKDPYALRRAANGVIKIATSLNLEFEIDEILGEISSNYAKFDLAVLRNFILDRFYTFFSTNPSIIKSCLNSDEREILRLFENINALDKISNEPSFKENFSTFKRLANIIKDSQITSVDESLIGNEFEKALNDSFKGLKGGDAHSKLSGLFGLKPQIDAFFDNVMINADEPKIKANRIAIIGQIYNEFLKIADIKEISL
ncbi:glycine--tRNA ligase subunit beta [Campylobacter gastrosuis]|uniref:Glycine--tRNA ligase beta subunit n=1 Tax=Campylobacter gastrosuis TaxID=2974576 RepID=A0ABT7HPM2_9BACT|nr:glycine--tRNA ligase subunit beta [Campylobacter gastrosuis]MDL0088610.1 glycine--tRNA ligase subunit beta [Campylobacter gastrosuis]